MIDSFSLGNSLIFQTKKDGRKLATPAYVYRTSQVKTRLSRSVFTCPASTSSSLFSAKEFFASTSVFGPCPAATCDLYIGENERLPSVFSFPSRLETPPRDCKNQPSSRRGTLCFTYIIPGILYQVYTYFEVYKYQVYIYIYDTWFKSGSVKTAIIAVTSATVNQAIDATCSLGRSPSCGVPVLWH